MESAPIRVPYRNLKKEIEVEMVGLEMESPPPPRIQSPHTHNSDADLRSQSTRHHISLITLVLSCTVAAGVQFGWALQLSLLTPYIQATPSSLKLVFLCVSFLYFYQGNWLGRFLLQTLGIGHAFSSFIWLCGPITGLVVGFAKSSSVWLKYLNQLMNLESTSSIFCRIMYKSRLSCCCYFNWWMNIHIYICIWNEYALDRWIWFDDMASWRVLIN